MQEYEIIKQGRTLLAVSRESKPSQRTIASYREKARRIWQRAKDMQGDEVENLIACAKQTRSVATWFSRRAALLHMLCLGVEKLLAEQDKMQRALRDAHVPPDAPEWAGWRELIVRLRGRMAWIERLQGEPGPAIENRKPRHSKRKDMHGLPEDWRERLIARLPKYRIAALVQAVTGCRPDELVRGVKLSIMNGELTAEIIGAKVTEKSGQPWRRLSWPVESDSPLVAMLVEEVQNGLVVAQIADAKAYSGAVRAAGKREWPRRQTSLSPYCFRHAAASDMKAAGMEDAAISQALGHCADVAKSYYGQWQQGRKSGGVAPAKVEASRSVRVTKPVIGSAITKLGMREARPKT